MPQADRRLRVIQWVLAGQGLATVAVAVVGLAFGVTVASSAMLGGLICWLPTCYFAWRAFRHRGARAAQQIVRGFYAAAAGKMVLTMAAFAIVFIQVRPLDAAALFAGFIAVQTLNWIVPVAVARSECRVSDQK